LPAARACGQRAILLDLFPLDLSRSIVARSIVDGSVSRSALGSVERLLLAGSQLGQHRSHETEAERTDANRGAGPVLQPGRC
jgi:hypothetical protein